MQSNLTAPQFLSNQIQALLVRYWYVENESLLLCSTREYVHRVVLYKISFLQLAFLLCSKNEEFLTQFEDDFLRNAFFFCPISTSSSASSSSSASASSSLGAEVWTPVYRVMPLPLSM